MIVKPTVKELLQHADNRFELVIATSRRARQIVDEIQKQKEAEKEKDKDKENKIVKETKEFKYKECESAVTVAANEINDGEVEILREEIPPEESKQQEEETVIEENENKDTKGKN